MDDLDDDTKKVIQRLRNSDGHRALGGDIYWGWPLQSLVHQGLARLVVTLTDFGFRPWTDESAQDVGNESMDELTDDMPPLINVDTGETVH